MRKAMMIVVMAVLAGGFALDAGARAGMGGSMGSRGGRTYSTPSYNAAPIQRSITPRPSYTPNSPSYAPSYAAPATGGGFWRNAAGGFLGAGLASMMFGHSGYAGGYGGGYGNSGGGGFGLLPWLLIGGGIWWFLRRRRQGPVYEPNAYASGSGYDSGMNALPAAAASTPITLSSVDTARFAELVGDVQQCWSEGDMNGLRRFVTPEMMQYFKEQLSANASRGLVNKVEDVTGASAETLEAWHEYDLDYATARMRWSAKDYMEKLEGGVITEGSRDTAQGVEEIWTFVRASGGQWMLSAIQQVS